MTSTLTDRYLHAALKFAPAAQAKEIEQELRSSIGDMVDARVTAGEDEETAEYGTLIDLGDPRRLAAEYRNSPLTVIGPGAYLSWRRVMIGVLAVVVPLVAVAEGIGAAIAGEGVGAALVSALYQLPIQIAFWVTLIFAIMERGGAFSGESSWTPDTLPEPPESRVSLSETILGSAFAAVVIAFFPAQHYWSIVGGAGIPVLDPALWNGWIPVLIASLAGTIVWTVLVYRAGRVSYAMAGVNALIGLVWTVPVVWLCVQGQLLNPALIDQFGWLSANARGTHLALAVGVVAVYAWDTIDTFLTARRHQR